jgi:hypothetical protein
MQGHGKDVSSATQMREGKTNSLLLPHLQAETQKGKEEVHSLSCIQHTPKVTPRIFFCLCSGPIERRTAAGFRYLRPWPNCTHQTAFTDRAVSGPLSFGEVEHNVISRSEYHVPMERQSGERTLTPVMRPQGRQRNASVGSSVPRNCPGGTRACTLAHGQMWAASTAQS